MRPLSDTITRMANFRGNQASAPQGTGRLKELVDFGSNPGSLRARIHIPDDLGPNAPLVVVLHGCTQNADGYDRGTGWSQLADREGFALLFPEQVRGNNANLCFNWFVPGDIHRGQGEVQSIAQMVERMIETHKLDRTRVFVTGLSAGGAMTSAMLATCPELFAGGAIVAGLPYACAASVPEAFDRMRGQGGPGDALLTALVKAASDGFCGPWPTVSIWHGTADATVSFSNMARIGQQWRGVHDIDDSEYDTEVGPNWQHRTWTGRDGRKVVEEWSITGMGHGVPIEGSPGAIGAAAPYVLATGVSSTEEIARSWGLVGAAASAATTASPAARATSAPAPRATAAATAQATDRASPLPTSLPKASAAPPVQEIIENALRAAGLMR